MPFDFAQDRLGTRGVRVVLFSLVLMLGFTLIAVAQATKPAGVTGVWKWSTDFGGQAQENVLTLKQEGDKITGTISGFGGDSPISDAKLVNGELTFKVSRDFGQGTPFVTVYTGKIDGDSFKGKQQTIIEQAFDAKRSK